MEVAPQGTHPVEKGKDWGRTLSRLWITCAVAIGSFCVAGGLWYRVWFVVLFGIPWLSVAVLLRLNENDPLPVVDDPLNGATSQVTAAHPRHLALFGLTLLSVGLLIGLPSLGFVDTPSPDETSYVGAFFGGLFAIIGAALLGQGLYLRWRRGRKHGRVS